MEPLSAHAHADDGRSPLVRCFRPLGVPERHAAIKTCASGVLRRGHFASKRLKAVGDLPRGMVARWKRSGPDPQFVFSAGPHVREVCARVNLPITAVLHTDHSMASHAGVWAMHAHRPNASVTHAHVRPQGHRLRPVGHFNFFHSKTGPHGWSLSLPWLGLGSPTPSP